MADQLYDPTRDGPLVQSQGELYDPKIHGEISVGMQEGNKDDAWSNINNTIRSVSSAVPGADQLSAFMNAATPGIFDHSSTKDNFWDRYHENLDNERAQDKSFSQAHPVLDAAGKVVGNIGVGVATAPTLGAGTFVNAAKLGAQGAALSGAQGFANSDGDLGIAARDALIGGAFGAGFPVAGAVLGKVGGGANSISQWAGSKLSGISREDQAATQEAYRMGGDAVDALRAGYKGQSAPVDPALKRFYVAGQNLKDGGWAPQSTVGKAAGLGEAAELFGGPAIDAALNSSFLGPFGPFLTKAILLHSSPKALGYLRQAQGIAQRGFGQIPTSAATIPNSLMRQMQGESNE